MNSLIELYLNFAELQAKRNIPTKMKEWIEILDSFLKINRYEILKHVGKISHQDALIATTSEYEKFRVMQDKNFLSDFDNAINKLNK